jgi:hypothetical protein
VIQAAFRLDRAGPAKKKTAKIKMVWKEFKHPLMSQVLVARLRMNPKRFE